MATPTSLQRAYIYVCLVGWRAFFFFKKKIELTQSLLVKLQLSISNTEQALAIPSTYEFQ